ncbi:MAG: hypothetical protein ACOZAN_00160 [Patescibacteria group bacterium]
MLRNKISKLFFLAILATAGFVRLFQLSSVPKSLYWEEVALGYDAFSILQTGKDHHGNSWPVVAFESFGDWKPPGYFYALVPFIKLFGLTELAIRLPSALAGIISIVLIFLISQELLLQSKDEKIKKYLPFLAMILATVSPWGILFSRAAWEVNLATMLLLAGILLLFVWKRLVFSNSKIKSVIPLAFACLLFVASMYTYHSTRVISPSLALVLLSWFFFTHQQQVFKRAKTIIWQLISVGTLTLILLLPLLFSLTNKITTQRFAETSLFSDQSEILFSNQMKEIDDSWSTKLESHRYYLYSKKVLANFFSHLSLDFLFNSGDKNPRHSVQFFGQMYYLDIALILLGAFYLLKEKRNLAVFIFLWIVICLIPASLTLATPHGLRILPAWPALIILVAFGWYYLVNIIQRVLPNKFFGLILTILMIGYFSQFAFFLDYYFSRYVQKTSSEWQYGYKEMLLKVKEASAQHPDKNIYISRDVGRPAMYYWFYFKTDPREVQQANANVKKDQGEFLEFKNVVFSKTGQKENVIVADYVDGAWSVDVY